MLCQFLKCMNVLGLGLQKGEVNLVLKYHGLIANYVTLEFSTLYGESKSEFCAMYVIQAEF